jgi:hypothetical protein
VKLTERQLMAQEVLASDATHLMLYGGSRSGKTFLLVRNVVMRALKAPKSRHAILRFRFNAVKASIIYDTFPNAMEIAFPGVKYELNKTDWFATLDGGSQIWFGGLDDKERTEKILGQEYVTIYLNEASQIPWNSRNVALTRLAQKVEQNMAGRQASPLKPRMYYDCNPPPKSHWTYAAFHDKRDPEAKTPLPNPQDYAWFQINPESNRENLSETYIATLDSMSARMRKRFKDGEFGDATPNQLFADEVIDTWRVMDGKVPDFVRVVVAVDPSGAGDEDNADNDAIGIVAAALGTDGNAYVLEDCTVKAGPGVWGKVATTAFERLGGDCIVGETNFGGAMVKQTIQVARARTPFKMVTASRGKVQRAEPFSALYEQGKVRHVGIFAELEDELTAFSTLGYMGTGSPNRADALVWALAELFPGLIAGPKKPKGAPPPPPRTSWMG